MSKNCTRSGFSSVLLRFLFPIVLVAASYSLGAYTEAHTMRDQSIQLGTSGYDPKTSQWGLYNADKICQEKISALHSQDATLVRAAQEDTSKPVQEVQDTNQPPKLPVGIFLDAQKKRRGIQ